MQTLHDNVNKQWVAGDRGGGDIGAMWPLGAGGGTSVLTANFSETEHHTHGRTGARQSQKEREREKEDRYKITAHQSQTKTDRQKPSDARCQSAK